MKFKVGRKKITLRKRDWVGLLLGIALTIGFYETMQYVKLAPVSSTLTYQQHSSAPAWAPDTVTRWNDDITATAKNYDIDPQLIAIIMTLESGGHTKANSGVAKGLMQVTDYTGADIAAKFVREPRTEYDLFDPATSIEFGAAYLAYLRNTFCTPEAKLSAAECVEIIAAGYNGGPGAANSLQSGEGLSDMQTVGYSRDAYNMWRERIAPASLTYQRWLERGGQSLVDAARAEM